MKTLVVYYSHDGSTKLIANTIANTLNADIAEIKTEKNIDASGAKIIYWGLRQLITSPKPDIIPLDKNPNDYDLIVIGTPVWSYTYAPPIKTFFENYNINRKKIILFCCHGGQKAKTLENMKKALEGNEIIGENDFKEPIKYDTEKNIQKTIDWITPFKY